MREPLREVAERLVRYRIELFRVEPEIVCERQEALELPGGIPLATLQCEVLDLPERTDTKGPFARRQAVIFAIAEQKAAGAQLLPDSRARGPHARMIRVDVAVQRQHEQTCVDFIAVEGRDVALDLLIESASLDVAADRLPLPFELVQRNAKVTGFVQLQESIERHPAHHLRVRVMPTSRAPLPDPIVRFLPSAADRFPQFDEIDPGRAIQRSTARRPQIRRLHNSPYVSSCSWSAAALPTRTGRDPA